MELESKIQAKIIKRLTQEGWLCVKLIKTNCNGIPDILCLKDGKSMFVEVKRESGVLSELQKVRINQLKKQNFDVRVWTNYDTEFQY